MAKTIKRGKITYWLDGQGIEVPEKYIKDEDKARDKLVTSLVARARRLSAIIAQEKEIMAAQIAEFLDGSIKTIPAAICRKGEQQ